MEQKQLDKILKLHNRWLRGLKTGIQADLQGANLTRADLQGAYLTGAYLQNANLQNADLTGANLQNADLTGANLRRANLTGAYLQDADLQGAYLTGAYLQDADLDYSCLPLHCGWQGCKMDEKHLYQIIAHICANNFESDDFTQIKQFLLPYAKKSHVYKWLKDSIIEPHSELRKKE